MRLPLSEEIEDCKLPFNIYSIKLYTGRLRPEVQTLTL